MRYFTVRDSGMIPGININGPLTTPMIIPIHYVTKMLRHGRVIFEHSPFDKSRCVRLTLDNINTVSFPYTPKSVNFDKVREVPQRPVPEEPVVEEISLDEEVDDTTESEDTPENNDNEKPIFDHNNKKKNKHNKHNRNDKDVKIEKVETVPPITSADAFENVNFKN